ncbi:hypothetical protein HMPREF0850_01282 [Streptococcus sp. M143]|nr:hypothetical protein HMPREF0850_01282 [Streptococcus sp. M143]
MERIPLSILTFYIPKVPPHSFEQAVAIIYKPIRTDKAILSSSPIQTILSVVESHHISLRSRTSLREWKLRFFF